MSDKKKKYYRANVKNFVDSDYKHKLSSDELVWLEQFEGEIYANEINREDSIHRENLSEEEFKIARKSVYDATNAQNRDSYSISSTGSYLEFIESDDFYEVLVQPMKKIIDFIDPQKAFVILLNEVIEEIEGPNGRELDIILTELSIEMVKLGASISKQRAQKILKKRKERKEAKEKK